MHNDWTRIPGNYGDIHRRAMNTLLKTFENLSEGTFIVDKDARVVWINKRYAARFGFADPLDAVGQDCETVIPHSLMRGVVMSGKPILLDLLETDREPLLVTRLPLKDDSGETVGAIGFAFFDEMKALTPLFSHYCEMRQELDAARQALARARRSRYTFASFVGTSAPSLEVKGRARRAAQVDSPVLLSGETGTGKELLAHAIHGASARAAKPLVTINIAATPAAVLETELFGTLRAATAGVADSAEQAGKFGLADGGTLFLDEVSDLPLPLQAKLLRVLQDNEPSGSEPDGARRRTRADVRIISATSADLPTLVATGKFRADLFYRLNVLTIFAPPLRERVADIEALVYAMLEELSAKARPGYAGQFVLHDDAWRLLRAYPWPGNVRELRNTLERAVMLSNSEQLDARALAPFIGSARALPRDPSTQALAMEDGATTSYADAMAAFEKQFLADALRASGGRVAEAAQRIGIGRATLYKKIAGLGIEV
jgi:transcriptional regulator with PAS, ATPase and Fis domain